jgi:putative transposase
VLFEQRSEKALVSALVEMYVQGVSTRKVKAITEELCGHRFAASTISALNKGLDEGLTKFVQRRLTEDYPSLILDARYEKVREDGIIQSHAVLLAIGIKWEGQRNLAEAQRDLAAWLSRWQRKYPKLTDWVEENIGSALTFYGVLDRY